MELESRLDFRGKRLDKNEWVYGGVMQRIDGGVAILSETTKGRKIKAVPVLLETVGQCTEMLDVNGDKIYEGDILQQEDTEDQSVLKGFVGYNSRCGSFYLLVVSDHYGCVERYFNEFDSETLTRFAIVGNVYDDKV